MFYAQAQAILDGKVLPDGWQIHGDIDELTQVRSDLCLLANFSQVSYTTLTLVVLSCAMWFTTCDSSTWHYLLFNIMIQAIKLSSTSFNVFCLLVSSWVSSEGIDFAYRHVNHYESQKVHWSWLVQKYDLK